MSQMNKMAVVLVRPHRWHNVWPGNFCESCGLDDPLELAISCLSCRWKCGDDFGNGRDLVLNACFFHRFLLNLPCEGYAPVLRTSVRDPIARERCAYPGRWFLVSSDGLSPEGRRWWEPWSTGRGESKYISYDLLPGTAVTEWVVK